MRAGGRIFAKILGVALAGAITASPARAVGLFDINLNAGPLLAANPEALAAFERAAQAWEQYISSPIRINIDADLADIPNPAVIGFTSIFPRNDASEVNLDYTLVRDAMAAWSVRPGNQLLSALPTQAQLTASVPTELGGAFDNTTIGITRANQKALGLMPDPLTNTLSDAVMVFNQNFSFDYDRSDGFDFLTIDFETAAIHEIGHVLGFLSDTDDYDQNNYDLNPTLLTNVTTLDLFRFDTFNLPSTLEEFTMFPRELRPGHEAAFFDLVNYSPMATGAVRGDGTQASHWKDDDIGYYDPLEDVYYLGDLIGVMDPTLPFHVIEDISAADLRVMELIGYDVVPEPGSMVALLGAGWIAARRRI